MNIPNAAGLNIRTRANALLLRSAEEPYRVFFPLGTMVGLLGVALWPLYFAGWTEMYPGIPHTRLMVYGFFLGYILGFLGTAFPRLVDTRPITVTGLAFWASAYTAMTAGYLAGNVWLGDLCALGLLSMIVFFVVIRLARRKDLPPPGFVLAGMGLTCGGAGLILSLFSEQTEMDPRWILLQRLLSSQGLVLLPVLGVGGFLLPRFFGLSSRQELPESRQPSPAWLREAALAGVVGTMLVGSFVLESFGHLRVAYVIRVVVAGGYLWRQVPVFRQTSGGNTVSRVLKLGLALVLLGLGAVAVLPEMRVALLHTTFVGGLAVVTFVVATRVIFGHSGNPRLLQGANRWLWAAWALMILGMLSRIVGDFMTDIMISHYNYAAACWIAGVLTWAFFVLPRICRFPTGE